MLRKRTAWAVVLAMAAALVMTITGPASASVVSNACANSATANLTQLDVDTVATAPASVFPGDPVTLTGFGQTLALPGALFAAGYNLGLLVVGPNTVAGDVRATIEATNTVEGSLQVNIPDGTGVPPAPDPDSNPDGIPVSVAFTITDPDGTPGTGDETATDASVSVSYPDLTFTAGASGTIQFRQDTITPISTNGDILIRAFLGGGALTVSFRCSPGTVTPPDPGTATFIDPAPSFATTTIVNPPTAPVCVNESVSVGITQTVPIDLTDNCTDVNGNIDLTTFTVTTPSVGILTGANGLYSYTAPASDPGAPVTFDFSVSDTTALTSNTATTSITILANQCDATSGPCSLTEIVVQPVVGTTLTMSKVAGPVVMSAVVLNGQPQVSTGSLQDLTVINARGTAAGWNVTGYITDLGAPGGPTIVVPTGQTIPACSAAGSFGLSPTPHRLCIPGDNMGWGPSAAIAHDIIPGDVAEVSAGPAHATGASDWLTQLIGAGYGPYDGLGGLLEQNLLCSSPVDHSGGTFACDADLWLGVPASAGAGTYAGGLVLTLV